MPVTEAVSAVLADGEVVLVRELDAADEPAVLALHTGLTEQDSYFRFFGKPGPLQPLAHRITERTRPRHGAVGAFRAGTLLGVAHYEGGDDPAEAELAVAVSSATKARGIGTLLLEYLAWLASCRGIRRLSGVVLAENTRMLRVFTDLGLPCRIADDGPERTFVLTLDNSERYRASLAERERHADVVSLRSVLAPSSVAVIGAGRGPRSVGRAVLRNLIAGGFAGPLYAVNPHAHEIEGVACADSVATLPAPLSSR